MRRTLLLLAAVLVLAGCGAVEPAQTEPVELGRPAEPQRVELGWLERYPDSGPGLRFTVEALQVTGDGWSAEIAVTNATGVPFELGRHPAELAFGLMLFTTDDVEELDEAARDGSLPTIRRAQTIEPEPPAVLAPSTTWRAKLSASGSLADGSWVRVSFGPFRAQGDPPNEMEPVIVWITDRSHRL